MLDHLDDSDRANRIRNALSKVIREGKTLTRDLGGTANTDQFTDAIIAAL
jgi:isocitrate/isopropylmalate dehydrogenase